MKKIRPDNAKRKLILKPELIKILTAYELKRPRGGNDNDSCSHNGGGSNPSVPHQQ
jgi:hypothetical protein